MGRNCSSLVLSSAFRFQITMPAKHLRTCPFPPRVCSGFGQNGRTVRLAGQCSGVVRPFGNKMMGGGKVGQIRKKRKHKAAHSRNGRPRKRNDKALWMETWWRYFTLRVNSPPGGGGVQGDAKWKSARPRPGPSRGGHISMRPT